MSALSLTTDVTRPDSEPYDPRQVPGSDRQSALWRRFQRRGDPAARAELLEQHLHLVRILARKLAARLGGIVEVDDLISAGTLGLVQSLESYDLTRANSFATYASRRIHGAMLDELRRRDWVPRSVRSKARKIQRASGKIESVLGRSAAPREMAAVLEIDLPTYYSWCNTVDGAVQISLNDSPMPNRPDIEPGEVLEEDCLAALTREEQVDILARALSSLPARERQVLVLYFYEELNLREIAGLLHLTESRISQIRSAALRRLRRVLAPQVA